MIARKVPVRGLLLVAAIWFAGMGVAAIAVQPDSVVGFGPPATMISAVAASDGYLLDAGRFLRRGQDRTIDRAQPVRGRSLVRLARHREGLWPAVG